MMRRSLPTIAAMLACGCASAPASRGGTPEASACVVPPAGAAAAADTVRIALGAPADPSRPDVRREDPEEALLRAAIYESLLVAGCDGAVLPALATRWSAEAGGARWTFELDAAAAFADGSAVTPTDVVASWTGAAAGADDPRSRIANIVVTGSRTLAVDLDRPAAASFFADRRLVVHRGGMGTGPYGVVPGTDARRRDPAVRLRLVRPAEGRAGALPLELHFAVPPSADMRTALDLGADVVITRDPAVLDYARALTGYRTTALPWDRTYVLLAPGATSAEPVPQAALESLARDAVRGDARAPVPPPGGPPVGLPPAPQRADGSAQRTRRIVYERDDDVARALAERLVALAAAPVREPWLAARLPAAGPLTAHALAPREFARALSAGRDAAYVTAIATVEDDAGALAWPWTGSAPSGTVTSLVQTRPTLIHGSRIGPVWIDAAGTIRFGLPPERGER